MLEGVASIKIASNPLRNDKWEFIDVEISKTWQRVKLFNWGV